MASVLNYLTFSPNIITLVGYIFNVIIFAVTLYYSGWKGGAEIPPWACYLSSFLYFGYNVLDNLDGKHARRTNSSSPLGMMFDHGCDALVTFTFTLGLGSIVGLTSIGWYTTMWLMTSIPFFLNTWEEFYTGELNLPIVHGVSEGTLTACIAMALTGYYGLEFWNQEANILGLVLKYNEITTLFCFITGMFFALLSLMNVILKYKEKRRDVFLNLIIFFFLVLSLVIVVNYADSIIVEKYPKIIIILYGFAFSKLVGHLQLAHICDSEFMQYRKSLLISFAWLSIVALLKHFYAIDVVNIDNLIIILLILNIIVWVHFAYYVTEELCDLLGINRFTLKKRNKLD